MKFFVWGLLVLGSVESAYAVEERPKLECQWQVPSCQDHATEWRAEGDDGTIRFADLPSRDLQVNAAASLSRNDDEVTSTMTIQLTDSRTGNVSPISKYTVRKDQVVEGGVFNFKASNGKLYSVACQGSRFAEGVNDGMMPCPPVKPIRLASRSRRLFPH